VRQAPSFALRIVRAATRLDPKGIELGFGVRCTVGVAIPLVTGLLTGHTLDGVAGAIGALPVGFASRQGVYRTGAVAALLTAAAVAFSAFVGAVCGGNTFAAVVVAALWGFAYGLLASLGPTALVVGVNACVVLAIFGQFHVTPQEALVRAGFVFAGGLVQTVLLVAVWPLARFKRERGVLAAAYRALAAYGSHFPDSKLRPPEAATFAKLDQTLSDPQPFASRGEIVAFEALLVEAERIRGTLAALASDRYVLGARASSAAHAIGRLGATASDVLGEIAAALAAARAPTCGDGMWAAFDAPIADLESGRDDATVERALGDAEALLGQLRSAWRAASAPADVVPDSDAGARAPRILRPSALVEALSTLRANLSFRSGFAQHGIRVAVTLAIATLAAHALPLDRAYWIALTAVLVLRDDFHSTFTRGIARILGTLAGAVVASIVAHLVHPHPETLLVLAVAFAFVGYVVFAVNYALYSLTVTGYVIFLLAFGGLPEHVALIDRVEETLIGGALALAAYAVWPTWERALVPERLAEMLEKQRRYASLVLHAYVNPSEVDAALRVAQRESWLARSNAETSVDRMLAEPVRPRAVTVRAALGVLAASRRFGVAALSLQARMGRAQPVATTKLGLLADDIDRSFEILEDALRRHADPEPLPHLRDAQIALVKRLDASPDPAATSLAADTDLMVDSINTIAHVLHRLREHDSDVRAS
jgi:uncharacterized membrane protein YccC